MKDFEITVYRLIAREIDIRDFERWVYAEEGLEALLTPDDYLELISLNYGLRSSFYEAEKILERYIDIGKYYAWRLRRVLRKVIERPANVHEYIEKCYDLYCNGYNFLGPIGLDYGLSIIFPPDRYGVESWDELTSSQQTELIDGFYPRVRMEAEKVLHWLDAGEIVLIDYDENDFNIRYQDNRKQEEPDPKPEDDKPAEQTKKWWKFW